MLLPDESDSYSEALSLDHAGPLTEPSFPVLFRVVIFESFVVVRGGQGKKLCAEGGPTR
jgi:hypothetical protein